MTTPQPGIDPQKSTKDALQAAMSRWESQMRKPKPKDAKSAPALTAEKPNAAAFLAELEGTEEEEFLLRCPALRQNGPKVLSMGSELLDWMVRVIKRARGRGATLVLAGDSGTGKTHCLKVADLWLIDNYITAWERGYWDNPISWERVDWPSLCSSMEKTIDNERISDLCECGVLLLDDIGSEVDRYKNGSPAELLRRVLGSREGKFTLITTNIKPDDWAKRWDARVSDRLLRGSIIVELFGTPSFSIRK